MNLIRMTGSCAVAAALSTMAHAQSAGTIFFSAGWYHVAPQDSSNNFRFTSVGGSPVNVIVPNTGVAVSNADTFGMTGGYFLTDHIAAEFQFGVPPKYDVSGTGALAPFGKLGTVREWAPVLSVQYFFLDAKAKFRPYVGIGVTRTWFSDARSTNTAFETEALGGPTTVESTAQWAPVFNVGFTYAFTEHWFAGFSVAYVPINTTSTFTTQAQTPVGTLTRRAETKVSLDPIVTYLRVGYRF
ncbi:OmpW/AlkL family protein [Caballeronia sp. 15715]|uniref:OmpW/AlkL family protein n=1 Tax=Caballeronia sp. 15715 TaxID=3391030 RepID=UPI0039E23CB0